MDYYKQEQFLAEVDKDDRILGKVEKWDCHKKAVLHRGYTCILTYKDNYILQHRKHPVFDGVFDLSFSSHQIYINNTLQDDLTAIYDGLKREWNLTKDNLVTEPKFIKKIYYRAKDPNSNFAEHEIDYIYKVELKNLPDPNLDFSYGFKLLEKMKIKNLKLKINIAPWVKTMLEEKVI